MYSHFNPSATSATPSTSTQKINKTVGANVAASAVAVAALPANATRNFLRVDNRSDADLYLRYTPVATPASASQFDYYVPPRQTHTIPASEVPVTAINAIWVGNITGGSAVFHEGVPA